MEHFLHLRHQPYENIKSGRKDIEMRLLDEKRIKYKVGDTLVFSLVGNENEKIITKIINLHKFKNFANLYNNFDKIRLGYKEGDIAKPEDMLDFYSQEEQDKYGVVGIEVKIINNL